MKDPIQDLLKRCTAINDNARKDEAKNMWRNLRLVPETVAILKTMPLEGETKAKDQIEVLSLMLECVDELNIPRQVLDIRQYQLSLFDKLAEGEVPEEVTREEVEKDITRLEDYIAIDTEAMMRAWCKTYEKLLLFDPVECSKEWENCIYEVEEEVAKELKDTPRCMGFCFEYWAALRSAMNKRGIEWRSPHIMNPRVMFD